PPSSSGKGATSTPSPGMPDGAAAGGAGGRGGGGGLLRVAVDVDEEQHEWAVTVTAHNLFAPVVERLLEIPLDWFGGRLDGQVHLWMGAGDSFPNFKGRVDVRDLAFQIWESPCAFTGVQGAVVLEGQRLFLHGVEGRYGHVPLRASGDMDLNQSGGGQYRISAQVQPVEANLLMKTLNAKPLPYPLAGRLQGLLFCRGPLDAPLFEGTAELAAEPADVDAAVAAVAGSDAAEAVAAWRQEGGWGRMTACPSLLRLPTSPSTLTTVAELHGVRAVPVGGGEIRGAGTLWVCPQAEVDPSAVNVDCWASGVSLDRLLAFYLPSTAAPPPSLLGLASGEAGFRGSLLSPTVEAVWKAPQARGPLEGMQGSLSLSRDTAHAATHAHALDLLASASLSAPPPAPLPRAHAAAPHARGQCCRLTCQHCPHGRAWSAWRVTCACAPSTPSPCCPLPPCRCHHPSHLCATCGCRDASSCLRACRGGRGAGWQGGRGRGRGGAGGRVARAGGECADSGAEAEPAAAGGEPLRRRGGESRRLQPAHRGARR
ncbi:hypothetical protein CLOP_g10109, partial [Closterium sp. NIES-67]